MLPVYICFYPDTIYPRGPAALFFFFSFVNLVPFLFVLCTFLYLQFQVNVFCDGLSVADGSFFCRRWRRSEVGLTEDNLIHRKDHHHHHHHNPTTTTTTTQTRTTASTTAATVHDPPSPPSPLSPPAKIIWLLYLKTAMALRTVLALPPALATAPAPAWISIRWGGYAAEKGCLDLKRSEADGC